MKKLMAMAMAGMMVLSMAACGSRQYRYNVGSSRHDSGSSRHDSGSSKRGRIHGSSDCWHG